MLGLHYMGVASHETEYLSVFGCDGDRICSGQD